MNLLDFFYAWFHSLKKSLSKEKNSREMEQQTKGMEEQLRLMKRKMARQFVRRWKINKAL
jgi:hypothetical protein